MKLKKIDKSSSTHFSKGEKRISLYMKNGTLNFSSELARCGIFKPNQLIAFFQDETRPKDWYMAECETGFALKAKKDGTFTLTSSKFTHAIVESIGFNGKSCSFLVATEPIDLDGVKYYAILTSSIKFKEDSSSLADKM